MPSSNTQPDSGTMTPNRLGALSDAVFGIAVTFAVLNIALPANVEGIPISTLLGNILLHAEVYALNFVVVGIFWMLHHQMFTMLGRVDTVVLWLNLTLLMFAGAMPFFDHLIREYFMHPEAVILFSGTMSLISLNFLLLWIYATQRRLLLVDLRGSREQRGTIIRLLLIPLIFLATIPLSDIHLRLAKYTWLLIIFIRPFSAAKKRVRILQAKA